MNLLFLFDFGKTITEGFFSIFLFIDGAIFSLISSAYKIFMALAGARLFTNDMYVSIANSVYFIIGVAMLFVLSYAIIKGIIDPDKAAKGEMIGSKMVKSILIAVLGLALTPVMFNVLYQAQGIVLDNNIIGKIIFRSTAYDSESLKYTSKDENGNDSSTNVDVVTDDYISQIGGGYTALTMWQAFFRPSDDQLEDNSTKALYDAADNIVGDTSRYFFEKAKTGRIIAGIAAGIAAIGLVCVEVFSVGTLTPVVIAGGTALAAGGYAAYNDAQGLSKIGDKMTLAEAYAYAGASGDFGCFSIFVPNIVKDGQIKYSVPMLAICGVFVLYSFVSFSIDMGVRAAKLAYYQIIAPVPLIMQVIPKFKSNFDNYIKSVINTFLEVVVRVLVIYVVVYLIMHITDLFGSIDFKGSNLNGAETVIAMALLIIGLILFAKKAPQIITSTLGIKGGDLKFGIGKKLAEGEVFTAGAALGSMATSGIRNFRNTWSEAPNGTGFTKRLGKSVVSGVGGVGGAARRSVTGRIVSGKPVATARDMRNIAGKTSNETTKARQDRKDWYDSHSKGGSRNKATTFVLGHAEDLGRTINAWSAGTVNTEKEQAAMKFTKSLDSLKGNLREEAYKKDSIAKALKQQMESLKSQEVSKYRDGWSDEIVAEEVKKRAATTYAGMSAEQIANKAVDKAKDDYKKLKNDIDAAKAAGNVKKATELEKHLESRKNALNRANDDLQAAKLGLISEQEIIGRMVNNDALLDDADYSKKILQRQSEIEGYRQAMEARADSFIIEKASDSNSNTYKDIQAFLQENASYIASNLSTVLNSDSNLTVQQLIDETFGESVASNGSLDKTAAASFFGIQKDTITVGENKVNKKVPGTYEYKTYKRNDDGNFDEYLTNVKVSSDGTVSTTAENKIGSVSKEDFYGRIAVEAAASGKDVKSHTTISDGTSTASDTYKVVNNKYTAKVQRKAEQEKKN